MVTTLRLLQIIVALLIIPMAALGGMAMFSGGGLTPALQEDGLNLFLWSLWVPIPAILVAESVYRLMKHTRLPTLYAVPVAIMLVPLLMWAWQIFRLMSIP